jgi:hypothetical protein
VTKTSCGDHVGGDVNFILMVWSFGEFNHFGWDVVSRHRWTGRYEAHLWDNSCRKEGQTRKGRQGNDLHSRALMDLFRNKPL